MVSTNQYKKLQYQYEVLFARYAIRDHYFNIIVHEAYQNIGQVLSLIRVQLSLLSYNNSFDNSFDRESATEPDHLVGKVIQDLKEMCRNFNPDIELLAKSGIIRTLEHELKLLECDLLAPVIEVKGEPGSLPLGTELIVFRILQEMLFCITKEYKRQLILVSIYYGKNDVTFRIEYAGNPIAWEQFHLPVDKSLLIARSPLLHRAKLINARFQVSFSRAHHTCIRLKVPFKTSLYE